jgi:hypothetical protein
VNVRVVDVAPLMSVNAPLELGRTCHCTVGAGLPEAAETNVAELPLTTVWLAGLVVTEGAV